MKRPTRRNRLRFARHFLRHESLESRVCLSVDTASDTVLMSWRGKQVEARRDAWIVRAAPQVSGFGADADVRASSLRTGWRATDLGEGFFSLATPGVGSQDVLNWAARTPGVAYVEPDFVYETQRLPNDPSFGQLWGLNNTGQSGGLADADIDAPEAWDVTTGSRDVVIAVIDTGVDYNHPDLAANMWRNSGEIPGDRIDNDNNGFVDDVYGYDFANNDGDPMDDDSHGTHVAGTIGAVGNNGTGVVGVSWRVSIMAVKFLGPNGGSTRDAISAVNYVTRMRRDFGVNVVASNNSWGGGGFSQSLRDAIEAGGQAGILFVAAAGNASQNIDNAPSYPAGYDSDHIISVAATDRSNRLANFSNFGVSNVDIGAPGVAIYSTVPGNQYTSFNGTSMAAPHVAGAVALLSAAQPTLGAAELRSAILRSASPIASLDGKVATGGLLNVNDAVRRPANELIADIVDVSPDPRATAVSTITIWFNRAVTGFDLADLELKRGGSPVSLSEATLASADGGRTWTLGGLTAATTPVGSYLLTLTASGSGITDADGVPLSLSVRDAWTTEPPPPPDVGDTAETALAVTLSGNTARLSGRVGDGEWNSRDVDFYAVTLVAGQRLEIDVDAQALPGGSTLDSYLRVFNPSRQQVTANDDANGLDSFIAYEAPTAGTYYVGLSGYGNSSYDPDTAGSGAIGSTGAYQVAFTVSEGPTPLTADIVNVRPDPRTIAVTSVTVTFNRAVTGFDVSDLGLTRSGSSVSLAGATLASTDGGRTWTLDGLAAATTPVGTYTLTLNASGSGITDSTGEPLSASVSDSWAMRSATDAGDTVGTAQAVTLTNGAARLAGRIGDGTWTNRDVDFYAVTLAAGQRLRVDIDARSLPGGSTLDSYLRVFNSSRRQVAANNDSNGRDSLISYQAPTGGTYYVGVSGFGNSTYDPARAGSGPRGSTGIYEALFTVSGNTTPLTADIVNVSPDPRTTAVSSVVVRFNRAVSGFDLADLRLARSGGSVSLSGAALASTDGGTTWTLSGLTAATTPVGSYTLTLNASGSGITDAAGVPLSASVSDSWTMRSATDAGDTVRTARAVTLANGAARLSGRVGDGSWTSRDVDFYAVTLAAGQTLVIDIDAQSLPGGSTLDSYLRVFNSSRRQVAVNDDANGRDSYISYVVRTGGTYYVGVSGFGNSSYNPDSAGSGRPGSTGAYQVAFRVTAASSIRSAVPAGVSAMDFAALGSGAAAVPTGGRVKAQRR